MFKRTAVLRQQSLPTLKQIQAVPDELGNLPEATFGERSKHLLTRCFPKAE
ncbi:hypothetical protein [Scytonema sp. NUACC21]